MWPRPMGRGRIPLIAIGDKVLSRFKDTAIHRTPFVHKERLTNVAMFNVKSRHVHHSERPVSKIILLWRTAEKRLGVFDGADRLGKYAPTALKINIDEALMHFEKQVSLVLGSSFSPREDAE